MLSSVVWSITRVKRRKTSSRSTIVTIRMCSKVYCSLQHVMKIAVCKKDDQEDFSIVLEGVQVMTGLGNLTRACAILLGFTFALNLTYSKQLRNTFEAFQKLFLELELVC